MFVEPERALSKSAIESEWHDVEEPLLYAKPGHLLLVSVASTQHCMLMLVFSRLSSTCDNIHHAFFLKRRGEASVRCGDLASWGVIERRRVLLADIPCSAHGYPAGAVCVTRALIL